MIHIWLPNPQAPLRVWQDTTQSWQLADNWQEVATLVSLQAKSVKAKQVCLYFPSINLLKTQPNLPTSQIKALGEAGRRYLFEDISITSVEDLQVKIDNASLPSLYALHSADREQWQSAVTLAGLELVALLPDFVLLPTEVLPKITPDTPDMANQSAVFYQDNATQLLAFHHANMPTVTGMAVSHLPMLLAKSPALQNLWVVENPAMPLPNLQNVTTQITTHTTSESPRPVTDPTRQFFNFVIKNTQSSIPAYAKVIVMVLLLAGIFGLIVDGLRWYHYQKATTQTKSAIAMQYNQWFPNEKLNPQLNIQRQLQGKLINTQAVDNKLLTTLSSIQPVFEQYQITANSINYQGQNLQLNVTAKDNESLNKAVAQIAGQGINAKLGSMTGVTASITNSPINPTSTPSPMAANGAIGTKLSTATLQITL